MNRPANPYVSRIRVLANLLRSESAGGAILILSAAVALIWSNSRAAPLYDEFTHVQAGVQLGKAVFTQELHLWINDGLMAVFFLLVGLELRREMTTGELASVKRVALPGLAALGGMVVPACLYLLLNMRDPSALRGWAVPVATDIAFALAVISVLGRRIPVGLRLFLTALAIMDDLGAILVIAVFYTRDLDLAALVGAVLLWGGLFGLSRAGVRSLVPYLIGGVLMWALVFKSGIHATLAGVALAFVVPASAGGRADALDTGHSPALKLEHRLTPFVFYLVLPLFGLANAGLELRVLTADMMRDTVAIGILLGLVVGKQVGVFAAVWIALRLRLAQLPPGTTMRQMYGGAILCGIGFTMSLFIGDLAFRGQARGDEVKLAVFAASLICAALGLAWLAWVTRPSQAKVAQPALVQP